MSVFINVDSRLIRSEDLLFITESKTFGWINYKKKGTVGNSLSSFIVTNKLGENYIDKLTKRLGSEFIYLGNALLNITEVHEIRKYSVVFTNGDYVELSNDQIKLLRAYLETNEVN